MTFTSSTQPLCRYCAGAIRKRTHTVLFGQSQPSLSAYITCMAEKPISKAEAQRLVNQKIVSLSWDHSWEDGVPTRSYIHKITTWDGESYEDEFFCTGEHARKFGYASARGGQAMKTWIDAMAARKR